MNDKIDLLESRLANTERALIALWTLLSDTVPPAYQDDITIMIEEYFYANKELGANFNPGFINEKFRTHHP